MKKKYHSPHLQVTFTELSSMISVSIQNVSGPTGLGVSDQGTEGADVFEAGAKERDNEDSEWSRGLW